MKVCTDACLFGAWMPLPQTGRLLDIGTGTGLLSLMAAQRSNASVDAVELQAEAALEARANVHDSPWRNRIAVYQGDILNPHQPVFKNQYDAVFSNPPFYDNHLLPMNAAYATAHHQRSLSLPALLEVCTVLLSRHGVLSLLLPAQYENSIDGLTKTAGFYLHRRTLVKNTAGTKLIRVMVAVGRVEKETMQDEIAIYNDDKSYTHAFTQLLSPFYLYL